jgi:hypothetical protein
MAHGKTNPGTQRHSSGTSFVNHEKISVCRYPDLARDSHGVGNSRPDKAILKRVFDEMAWIERESCKHAKRQRQDLDVKVLLQLSVCGDQCPFGLFRGNTGNISPATAMNKSPLIRLNVLLPPPENFVQTSTQGRQVPYYQDECQ